MHILCQVADLICYLDGQLTGRAKSDGLQLFLLRIDLLKKRDTKGCCLTGSSLGLADDIGALQFHRNGLRLDRGSLLKSHIGHGTQDTVI